VTPAPAQLQSADPVLEPRATFSGRARAVRTWLTFRFPIRYRVVWVALAALLIVCAVHAPGALEPASLRFITTLGSVLFIVSLGELLVVMLGGIDLSIPSVLTAAAAVILKVSGGADAHLASALLLVLGVSIAVGLLNGFFTVIVGINPIIVTLAMNGIVSGAVVLWAGISFSGTGVAPPGLIRFANSSLGWLSSLVFCVAFFAAAFAFILRFTRIGRHFVAVGTNARAAGLIGIRVTLLRFASFVVAAVLYGIAGILLTGVLRVPDFTVGAPYLLSAIIVVVVGGALLNGGSASVVCTVAAAAFFSLLNQLVAVMSLGAGEGILIQGVVLLVAVALQSVASRVTGLFRFSRRFARKGALYTNEAPSATGQANGR
jgi:ribose transport system permease protein